MQARLIYRNKKKLASGAIAEEVVWKLPHPEPDRPHGYKYRLVYVRGGKRIVGYDNERGKGDHRHWRGSEERYQFVSLDRLLADFRADVVHEEGRK